MDLSNSMCVCVCVCVTFFRTGHTLAKIKNVKNDVCSLHFDICHRMAYVIAKFVLLDLQCQMLKMLKICEIRLFSHVAGKLIL